MRTVVMLPIVCGLILMSAAADEPGKREPDKVAREITDRAAEAIQKQVDFTKEHLLLFQWSGSGRDQLALSVEVGKETPVVVFTHTPGLTRDLRPHIRIYAINNDATWRIGKPGRLKAPVKITTAEELAKHLPAATE